MRNARAPLAAALVAAVLVVPASETAACINEVEVKLDPRVSRAQLAEARLEKGENARALFTPGLNLDPAATVYGKNPIERRAWTVAALAIARSGGKLDITGETAGDEAAQGALRRAVAISTQHYQHKRDDNTVRTNHGEILSNIPGRREEALRILTSLESTDLMTSAFGYAALARLRYRAAEGHRPWIAPAFVALGKAPAALAVSRCERMAKNKEICSWKPGT